VAKNINAIPMQKLEKFMLTFYKVLHEMPKRIFPLKSH